MELVGCLMDLRVWEQLVQLVVSSSRRVGVGRDQVLTDLLVFVVGLDHPLAALVVLHRTFGESWWDEIGKSPRPRSSHPRGRGLLLHLQAKDLLQSCSQPA